MHIVDMYNVMLQRLRYMTSDIHSAGLKSVIPKPTSVQRILSSMCVYAYNSIYSKAINASIGKKIFLCAQYSSCQHDDIYKCFAWENPLLMHLDAI